MVSFWWDSVDQAIATSLLGVVVLSWVVIVGSRMGNLDKAMLGERVMVLCVLVKRIIWDM